MLMQGIHSSLFTKTNKNQFGEYFNALAIFWRNILMPRSAAKKPVSHIVSGREFSE